MKTLDEATRKEFEALCLTEQLDSKKREKLHKLLKIKEFVKRSFENGLTPLHFALKSKKINKLLIELIASDADLNQKNQEGKTPLEVAIEKKEYLVAYLLIKKGARLEVSSEQRNEFISNIKKALENQHHHEFVLSALIDYINKHAFISLCRASAFDPAEFKRLIAIKGFLDSDIGSGYSPLQYALACTYQHDKRFVHDSTTAKIIAKALIEAGAIFDRNKTKKPEYSPLALAVKANQQDLLSLMLEKGADPNFVNKDGNTLLTTAVNHAYDLGILERLLLEGADPMLKNRNGKSAFSIAMENKGFVKKVDLMRGFIQASDYGFSDTRKRAKKPSTIRTSEELS